MFYFEIRLTLIPDLRLMCEIRKC